MLGRLGNGLLTRRAALASGAALFAGTSVASIAAQDATPAPAESGEGPTFLFVQLADEGTWTVSPDNPEEYVLTLAGVPRESLYFSDRPDRIVGAVPTAQLLEGLGFTRLIRQMPRWWCAHLRESAMCWWSTL